MKKCPNCQKTFNDDKRFCQIDGTPLVDDIEPPQPEDPFKTVVIGSQNPTNEPEDLMKTMVIRADSKDDDLLQIPESFDPMKTMVVKEPFKFDEPVATPPISEPPAPEPPKFNEPSLKPPTFGDLSAEEPPKAVEPSKIDSPFSPFNEPPKVETPISNPFNEPPKIDSPFSTPFNEPPKPIETPKFNAEPKPSEPVVNDSPFSMPPSEPISSPFDAPKTTLPPVFKEPEPAFGAPPSPFDSPFNQPNEPVNQPFQQNEWNPPPVPSQGLQNQPFGGEPLQPSAVAPAGQNNTLAMVSLGAGILGFLCLPFIGSIVAIITGFMQKGKIKSNPAEYGGAGLAKAGTILGFVALALYALGIIGYIVLIMFILS